MLEKFEELGPGKIKSLFDIDISRHAIEVKANELGLIFKNGRMRVENRGGTKNVYLFG